MQRSKPLGGTTRILGLLAIAIASPAFADPTTKPSVASVLSDMDTAYAKLQSAQFDGHIIGRFDAAGQTKNEDVAFTSSFAAPNQFRHEVHNDILLGCTGTSVFSFLTSRDEYQNAEAPKARVASGEWPASITSILQDQNPSLLLAMSKSASSELNELSQKITLESPTTIDGISYDTLKFDVDSAHESITMLVDPATHLLHEVKFDLAESLKAAGTAEVKQAEVTIDYTRSQPDAPMAGNVFAWSAPVGAILTSATDAMLADDAISDDVKALIGKPAPDFSLKTLDDKTIKLSDEKGSVVVVDLWATWCAPCVASMPHLDQLNKDQGPNGLKVFAVNVSEEKAKVKEFVDKHGWSLPVLLDPDGATSGAYKQDSFPQTVVVGKDGKIAKIFIGIGHEQELAALVKAEMAK